jgi:hypothetical protein
MNAGVATLRSAPPSPLGGEGMGTLSHHLSEPFRPCQGSPLGLKLVGLWGGPFVIACEQMIHVIESPNYFSFSRNYSADWVAVI